MMQRKAAYFLDMGRWLPARRCMALGLACALVAQPVLARSLYVHRPADQMQREYGHPLVNAAEYGDIRTVTTLLNRVSPDSQGAYGTTALMRAASHGHTEIIRTLLKAGASPNAQDAAGRTPLNYAAQHGHAGVAETLIKHGADVRKLSPNQRAFLGSRITLTRRAPAPAYGNRTHTRRIYGESYTPMHKVYRNTAPAETRRSSRHEEESSLFTNDNLLIGGVVLAAGAGIAAAAVAASDSDDGGNTGNASAGGGDHNGGGGSGDSGTAGVTLTLTAPPQDVSPSTFETAEYQGMNALAAINASAAYGRGYTGKTSDGTPIRVAVIDSGMDRDHPEFSGKVTVMLDKDYVDDDNNADAVGQGNFRSHGTHVAGIIAARKDDTGMHGVAYDAEILPIRVFDSKGNGVSDSKFGDAVDHAVASGAQVINNSWGTELSINADGVDRAFLEAAIPGTVGAFIRAAAAQVITVFSTGNHNDPQPDVEAGLPFHIPELKGHWLAVAGVNAANQISKYSNHCGVAKDWCMVAPGISINSTYDPDDDIDVGESGYEPVSGTSTAAPQVAGAAAILLAAFPYLTPEQVVQILLASATDLGEAGVDDVYGHGLLNLERATRPGDITVVPLSKTVNGMAVSLAQSQLKLSAAFGDAVQHSGLQVAFLDQWKRSYKMALANLVAPRRIGVNMAQLFDRFGQAYFHNKVTVGDAITLNYAMAKTGDSALPEALAEEKTRFSLTSHFGDSEMRVYHHLPVREAFGFGAFEGTADNSMMLRRDALHNPYFSLVGEATGGLTQYRTGRASFRFGGFHGNVGNAEDNAWAHIAGGVDATMSGMFGETVVALDDAVTLGLQAGYVRERHSFLGSATDGAFSLGDNTATRFVGVSGHWQATQRVSLFGHYTFGWSDPSAGEASLVSGVSGITSDAFGFGARVRDVGMEGAHWQLSISQPLRVRGGSADLRLPEGRDMEGNILSSTQRLNLTPTGREIDLETSYSVDLNTRTSLKTGALLRLEPDHRKDADPEGVFVMKAKHRF